MDYKQLFLSPQGRLNRKPYWIGVLILLAIQLAGNLLFANFDPEAPSIPAVIVSLLLGWRGSA